MDGLVWHLNSPLTYLNLFSNLHIAYWFIYVNEEVRKIVLCYTFHFELILRVIFKKLVRNVGIEVLTGALLKIQVFRNSALRWWVKFPASQGQIPYDLNPRNKYLLEDSFENLYHK